MQANGLNIPRFFDLCQLKRIQVKDVEIVESIFIADSAMNEDLMAVSRDGGTNSRRDSRSADFQAGKAPEFGIVFMEVVVEKDSRICFPLDKIRLSGLIHFFHKAAEEEDFPRKSEGAI